MAPGAAVKKLKPLPCPCCGNKKLYTGPTASCVLGVQCERHNGGCGLTLSRGYQERFPRGIRTLEAYDAYLLVQAVTAWNRRKFRSHL